jgi:hypothetical protein
MVFYSRRGAFGRLRGILVMYMTTGHIHDYDQEGDTDVDTDGFDPQ